MREEKKLNYCDSSRAERIFGNYMLRRLIDGAPLEEGRASRAVRNRAIAQGADGALAPETAG